MRNKLLVLFYVILSFCFVYAEPFTIAVIPDTQNYVNYSTNRSMKPSYSLHQVDFYYNQMQYIADNSVKNGGNIAFAVHVGDFVSHWGKSFFEWECADIGMRILDDVVPFIAVPGNHDYDIAYSVDGGNNNRIDGGETYCKYFGPDSIHFQGKDWYGGSFNGGMDSFCTQKLDGKDFLFLGLELEPSDDVLEWAQKVLDEHKNFATILVTHEYLSVAYEQENPGRAALLSHNYRKDYNRNTPVQIWEKLISKNSQIFLVLCGHHFSGDEGENARTDINDSGYKVYSLLQDYQGRKQLFDVRGYEGKKLNCGDGWLRILDFDLDKGQIHVQTYSTEFKQYEKDHNSDFTIKFDWDWEDRFGNK